jgi:hypothetical protein
MNQEFPQRRSALTATALLVWALATLFAIPERAALAQDAPRKVVLRFAADFTPPPHPAGMALAYFHDRLPQVIPGSEARIY